MVDQHITTAVVAHKAAWDAYYAECERVCGKRAMPDALYLTETATRTPELARLSAAVHVAVADMTAAYAASRNAQMGA